MNLSAHRHLAAAKNPANVANANALGLAPAGNATARNPR